MTASPATLPGADEVPTSHPKLLAWVREVAELTTPDRVVWVDGSDEEWRRLTDELVEAGTLVRLNPAKQPNSFWARTDPTDVARVEERTFICSVDEADAGPTNNWMAPAEMKRDDDRPVPRLDARPDDVRHPVLHGPARGREPDVRRRDHRQPVRRRLDAHHDPDGRHGAGGDGRRRRLRAGAALDRRPAGAGRRPDVAWPCNDTKYISHFPETREIWSYGSGYGGNSLLGKKCYSLRIASVMAPRRGLARRAHADPQADLAGGRGPLRRRRVPVGLRQDQPGHAGADHPRLEGRDDRRRHRLDAVRRGRPALRGQPRVRPVRRRARAPTGRPTPTRCAPSPRATRSSPTSR